MKRVSCIAVVALFSCTLGTAAPPTLNVDSAPNVYGSIDWAPWWSAARQAVYDGVFENMASGTYPGTLSIDPIDEIVYSTGDYGHRIHFVYWFAGESLDTLAGRFEVKWVVDWDGVAYTWDGALVPDTGDNGWSQPASWEAFHGGVVGSFGFAWWATDNEAKPFNTGGSAYDETDEADIAALRNQVFEYQTHLTGHVRYRESLESPWEVQTIVIDIVPPPDCCPGDLDCNGIVDGSDLGILLAAWGDCGLDVCLADLNEDGRVSGGDLGLLLGLIGPCE